MNIPSKIVEVIASCDEACNIRSFRSYSGRCMYGRVCLAFTSSSNSAAQVCAAIMHRAGMMLADEELLDDQFQEIYEALSSMKWDNMGFDTVYYFPNIEPDQESIDLGNTYVPA